MPELTAQELNVAVAKEAGYYVEQEPPSAIVETYWWLHKPNGEFAIEQFDEKIHKYARTAEEAWAQAPNFARSLDACKPLIEEMNASYEVDISFADNQPAALVRLLEAKNAIVIEYEFYKDAGLLSAAATALCRAYLKFKELTKEETNG